MSHAMDPEPAAEPRQSPADVSRSLFWDDVRAGLKVVSVGVIVLLVAELCGQFHADPFLVGATFLVGGLLCVIGLGICTALPREAGAAPWPLVAAGLAVLALLALLGSLVSSVELPMVVPLALAAAALMTFAIVLSSCTTYLGHQPLTAAARNFVVVSATFALAVIVVATTGLAAEPSARVLMDLLAIGVVAIFVYIAWGTSDAIVRVRQGHPVEAPRMPLSAAQLAAEELRHAQEVVYTQPAHPHFSEAEVTFFHADDSRAAGTIVVLLTSIFSVGIVLYTIVAWSVTE